MLLSPFSWAQGMCKELTLFKLSEQRDLNKIIKTIKSDQSHQR